MTIPPTTNEALQTSFDTATDEKIPHYFVDFPKWESTKPTLKDTVPKEPVFKNPTPLNAITDLGLKIKKLKDVYGGFDHVRAERPVEIEPNKDDKLEKMPHPFSTTNHIDPNVTKDDKKKLGARIKDLKTELYRLSELDGELNKIAHDALPVLERAEDLLPTEPSPGVEIDPKGMQRLKLHFEWLLCQITTLFGQINLALDGKTGKDDQKEYNDARDSYIALLRDLDNHEPLLKDAVPGKVGYGRNVKWVYFYPLIHGGRIKGVTVVAKWNPHISSSGVPIMHS